MEDGERQIKMSAMRVQAAGSAETAFQRTRSEGIEHAKFWKVHFSKDVVSSREMRSSNGKKLRKAKKKPKYEIVILGQEPFGMAAVLGQFDKNLASSLSHGSSKAIAIH